MDEDPHAGGGPGREEDGSGGGEVKWSGDVGAHLRRDETCLFETVGCVSCSLASTRRAARWSLQRGLGLLHYSEPTALTLPRLARSVMIDCSRNGVLRVESVKMLLRHMALMGSNMLQVRSSSPLSSFSSSSRGRATDELPRRRQLYCEDTYQIPGEPFFGAPASLARHSFLPKGHLLTDVGARRNRLLPRPVHARRAARDRRLRVRAVRRRPFSCSPASRRSKPVS